MSTKFGNFATLFLLEPNTYAVKIRYHRPENSKSYSLNTCDSMLLSDKTLNFGEVP